MEKVTESLSLNIESYSSNELSSPITFEKTETRKITYEIKPIQIINLLRGEIKKLNKRIDSLENEKKVVRTFPTFLTQQSLKEIWDNEEDDIWTNF